MNKIKSKSVEKCEFYFFLIKFLDRLFSGGAIYQLKSVGCVVFNVFNVF